MSNQEPRNRGYPVPALAAIGWIPYYLRREDVPPNAYTDSRPRTYDWLFDSGNQDPGDNLGPDGQGFLQIVRGHDYRGALFLSGDSGLARSMDRWLRTSVWAAGEGIVPLS